MSAGGLQPSPECVLIPDDSGIVQWPDGAPLDVGTDGKTALGKDGKGLQGPDGESLMLTPTGRAYLSSGQAFIIAVWPSGSSTVLTMALRGHPGTADSEVYSDSHGRLFTKKGYLVVTSPEGRPLSSHDGRYVVEDTKGKRLMLVDGTLVARAPDGSAVQWIDGSVAIVGADNRTVLGPDSKAFMRGGNPVEVDSEGVVRDSIGTYIVNTPAPQADMMGYGGNNLNTTPRHTRSVTPHFGMQQHPQSPDMVHTRSVQLKEALNNANIELRNVKDALEATQAELIAEKAKSKSAANIAAMTPPPAARLSAAGMAEDMLKSPEFLDLKRQLGEREEEVRQQRHEAEGVVAELQRELREAAHEDAAALHRLQLAVDTQTRRVAAREEELAHVQKRLEAEEARRQHAEDALQRERQQHSDEMRTLSETHRSVSQDYASLRQRAHEVEESHAAASDRIRGDAYALRAKVDELTRSNRQLEEALAICDRAGSEDTLNKDTELAHRTHLLDIERGKRERAEVSLLEMQQKHEAHCEEALNQLTNATVDRDRFMRMLREKERQVDEVTWEKESQAKELKRLRHDVSSKEHSQSGLLGARLEVESELKKEREGRAKEAKHHMARIQELTDEKNKALRMIPDAIADAERMRAVAEERVKTLHHQLDEALGSIDDYRSELASLQSDRDSVVARHRERDRSLDHERERLRSHEAAYRHDRESMESHMAQQLSSVAEKDAELDRLRHSYDKMSRKKERLERKLEQAKDAAATNSETSHRRAYEAVAIEKLEEQLRHAAAQGRDRDAVVETLRVQVQQLQEENRTIIEERQQAASMRLNAVQNVAKLHNVAQKPAAASAAAAASGPTPSPTSVWNAMPYQATAQHILDSPARPRHESHVLPASRTTSPPRKAKADASGDDQFTQVLGKEYARLVRTSMARNHPPVSPQPSPGGGARGSG